MSVTQTAAVIAEDEFMEPAERESVRKLLSVLKAAESFVAKYEHVDLGDCDLGKLVAAVRACR